MADKSSDLVQGTLDMLILKTLALEPMHGYGVAVRIEQISKGVFRVNAGSLFVAFGIRLALGAEPWAVRKLIVVEGMSLALIGMAIGLTAAFGLTRFMASFLFGVKPWDPFVFATIPGALGLVVFLSVMSPAIRASRVSPADALRYE
jgi:hypothetical protein